MHAEIFVLYRNGKLYSINPDRGVLIDTVEGNPDFAAPDDGVMPEFQIIKYVPQIMVGAEPVRVVSSAVN